jgi:hypothetical protein
MKLLMSVLLKHDFASMGTFQMKTLFLGMMHFQDEYTYDIHRVEKCDIHYAMPDGEVLPFCTFNVFPEVYRDKVQKQYSIPAKEWEKTHANWAYSKDKYTRNVKELEASELYKKTYGTMIDYFALPVNGGKAVKNFSNPAQPVAVTPKQVVEPIKVTINNASAATSHTITAKLEEKESKESETSGSCGCGGGGCGCGANEKESSCGCGGSCDC